MTETTFQLAQVNIARARGETTDPVMAEFVARLPEINALADGAPDSSGGSRPKTVTRPPFGLTPTRGS
jgi:hypothetical protein